MRHVDLPICPGQRLQTVKVNGLDLSLNLTFESSLGIGKSAVDCWPHAHRLVNLAVSPKLRCDDPEHCTIIINRPLTVGAACACGLGQLFDPCFVRAELLFTSNISRGSPPRLRIEPGSKAKSHKVLYSDS